MRKHTDVLIAGTGIAGLTSAIYCREAGLSVLVITKQEEISESNTNYAQGGIISAILSHEKKILPDTTLAKDILEAGCHFNNKEAVASFAKNAPQLVLDFLVKKVGIVFSTNKEGNFDYTEEAAHSQRRILHFEDHTGDTIETGLIAYAKKIGVQFQTAYTAIDIITNTHHSQNPLERYNPCETFGLYALENSTGDVQTLTSDAVILATGGIGNLYQFTTNPASATGDGIAMASRAGADIINAEFVQFHPTALFHKDIKRFLISESLRGEGAKLTDKLGRPFMERYSAQGELAPRDVVTRAIYEEMFKQGSEYMYLDIANHYRGELPIERRFSTIYSTCLSGGIDITKQPIPIVPAAHYFCGGIKVDLEGRSSIERLYAVGEVSCTGLHGANRLASTSLLEALLWGKNAATSIIKRHEHKKEDKVSIHRIDDIPDWFVPKSADTIEHAILSQDWKHIKMTMWNHVGIIRTRKGLSRAQADLDYHARGVRTFYREAKLNRDIIELHNGVEAARVVVAASIHSEKSVGCHFRKD